MCGGFTLLRSSKQGLIGHCWQKPRWFIGPVLIPERGDEEGEGEGRGTEAEGERTLLAEAARAYRDGAYPRFL